MKQSKEFEEKQNSSTPKEETKPESHEQPIYIAVQDKTTLQELVDTLEKCGEVAVDIETTGLDPIADEIVGLSFATVQNSAYYIPITHVECQQLPSEYVIRTLRPIFENPKIRKIGHHLKFDERFLLKCGLKLAGDKFDTLIAGALVDGRQDQGLKEMVKEYFGFDMPTFKKVLGKRLSFNHLDITAATEYACADADYTLRLKRLFEPKIKELGLSEVFSLEMQMSGILQGMEELGVSIDVDYLKRLEKEIDKDLEKVEAIIYDLAEEVFNIDSGRQLGVILYDKLGLEVVKSTKAQQRSTDKEALELLQASHPIIDHLIRYRGLAKVQSTYVRALPGRVNKITNRIHTNFRQMVITGRLSSSRPNLQNLPKDDDRIRCAFIASPGKILLLADYSQIELRVLAHLSGDKALIKSFQLKEDIHRRTASEIFKLPLDKVGDKERGIGKTINFGLLYGMSETTLASKIKVSESEAADYMQKYFVRYPDVKAYRSFIIKEAREAGYVTTILGRRINVEHPGDYFYNGHLISERKAINAPIQGSAADIVKLAMVKVVENTKGYDSQLLLQVHDELIFEVKEQELKEVAKIVKKSLENAYQLSVPLIVELKIGRSWGEAKDYEC